MIATEMEDGDKMVGEKVEVIAVPHHMYLCIYILPKRHMMGARLELHGLVFSS